MINWSSDWKASKKPGKQRKYIAKAPLHVKSKMMSSMVSKELKGSLKTGSLRVRKGDKVKVLRGQFKGKSGAVERVDVKSQHVFVAGVEFQKRDGGKALYPVHPSKLMITEVDKTDKRRVSKQ